jgi:hypothetical protein
MVDCRTVLSSGTALKPLGFPSGRGREWLRPAAVFAAMTANARGSDRHFSGCPNRDCGGLLARSLSAVTASRFANRPERRATLRKN